MREKEKFVKIKEKDIFYAIGFVVSALITFKGLFIFLDSSNQFKNIWVSIGIITITIIIFVTILKVIERLAEFIVKMMRMNSGDKK